MHMYRGINTGAHNAERDRVSVCVCVYVCELLSQVCHNVGTELSLEPITNEHLIHEAANREEGARFDGTAENFWDNHRQCACFDVRVFNPSASSCHGNSIAQMLL